MDLALGRSRSSTLCPRVKTEADDDGGNVFRCPKTAQLIIIIKVWAVASERDRKDDSISSLRVQFQR